MLMREIVRRKWRTSMTIIAVASSMVLLVAMLTLANGMVEHAVGLIASSEEDILITTYDYGNGIPNGHATMDELMATGNFSGVSPMAADFMAAGKNGSGVDPITVIGIGVIPSSIERFIGDDNKMFLLDTEIEFDGWFEEHGDPHYENNYTGRWTREALIDKVLAKRYDIDLGDTFEVMFETRVEEVRVQGIFTTDFTGMGEFEDLFGGAILLHLSEFQDITNNHVVMQGNITIVVDRIFGMSLALSEDLRNSEDLSDNTHWLREKYPYYSIATRADRIKDIEDRNVVARVFYTSVASVSLVIGLLFVASVMLMSVHEKTPQIGMMRAIGISRKSIFLMVLRESMVLIGVGGLLGIPPGLATAFLMARYITDVTGYAYPLPSLDPIFLFQMWLIVMVSGLIFSMIPAFKATRVNIVQAIHTVR